MIRSAAKTIGQAARTRLADPRVRRLLSIGIMLLSIGFLLVILARDAQSLASRINWSDYLGIGVVGVFLYLLSLLVQLAAWAGLMIRLGGVTGGWWHVQIFSYSHLLRRLPGVVWYIAGRTTLYRGQGVNANVPIVASGLEWLLLLVGSAIVLATFGFSGTFDAPIVALLALAAIGISAIVLRRLILSASTVRGDGRLKSWFSRMLSVDPPRVRDLALWLALYVAAYVVGGWILLLLVQATKPAVEVDLIRMTQVWALVGGMGTLLSAIVPAGLGLRELSLTVVLSPYVDTSAAVLISIILRVLFMLSDLVWGGALWLVSSAVMRRRNSIA